MGLLGDRVAHVAYIGRVSLSPSVRLSVCVCLRERERLEIRMRDKSGVCKAMLCCLWWSVDAANVDSRARFTLTSEADSTTRHDTTRHDASEETLPPSSPVNNTLYERSRKSRRRACRAGGDALSLATINRASSSRSRGYCELFRTVKDEGKLAECCYSRGRRVSRRASLGRVCKDLARRTRCEHISRPWTTGSTY